MNKKILLLFFLLLAVPLTGFAQQGDIDPQGDSSCVSIINNLRYRATDANTSGEVSALQDFLQTGGYLNSNPVGFFGLMTTAAVKKFQKDNNIIATGYVGPITRQKIKDKSCSSSTAVVLPTAPQVPSPTPTTPQAPLPTNPGQTSTTSIGIVTALPIRGPVNMGVTQIILTRNLDIGATGDDVSSLQSYLAARGWLTMPAGVAFGTFDQTTKNAVILFQQGMGISPGDGVVGPATRAYINASMFAVPTVYVPTTPITTTPPAVVVNPPVITTPPTVINPPIVTTPVIPNANTTCPQSITINGTTYTLSPCSIDMTMTDHQGDKNFSTTIVTSGTSSSVYGYTVYGYGVGFPTYGILGGTSGGATGNTTLNLHFNDSYLSADGNQPRKYTGYLPIKVYQGSSSGADSYLNLNVNLTVNPAN